MATGATRLDIYNMALGFLGTRTIGSPNENTPEAIQCNLFWDEARRTALRDFPYPFAQRRVQLAQKEMPEVYEGDWKYCYGMPGNALKVLSVHPMYMGRINKARPFAVRHTGTESVILTDVEKAQADITFDVESINLWDELFVMAMARKLACLIVVPLQKYNPQKVQELYQLYTLAVDEAMAHAASEEEGTKKPDSWIAARGGAWL